MCTKTSQSLCISRSVHGKFNCITVSYDLSSNQNQKPFENSLQVWLPELFMEALFSQKTANL